MSYASLTDMTLIYGAHALQVTDLDVDGQSDMGAATRALDSATAEIDTYLAVRYRLPLTSVPAVLVQLCVDIAMYRLAATADTLTDEIRRRYDDALAVLARLAKGVQVLPMPADDAPPFPDPTNPDAVLVVESAQPIFSGGPAKIFSRTQTRDL